MIWWHLHLCCKTLTHITLQTNKNYGIIVSYIPNPKEKEVINKNYEHINLTYQLEYQKWRATPVHHSCIFLGGRGCWGCVSLLRIHPRRYICAGFLYHQARLSFVLQSIYTDEFIEFLLYRNNRSRQRMIDDEKRKDEHACTIHTSSTAPDLTLDCITHHFLKWAPVR